jgi:CcmD family protein
LPLTEQMPAAPLLVGAYVVVLVGLFAYVLSVARRVGTVQREIERLDGELKRRLRT